jgi:hypothetical protein
MRHHHITFLILTALPLCLVGCRAAGASGRAAAGDAVPAFDRFFTGGTLRWDYYHSGSATEEHISLDGFRLEGDWPGSRVHLIDDTLLGKYLFEVIDAETGAIIYSRGLCSIYGEWETTDEAGQGRWRTFHESLRFPEPKSPVRLRLMKRAADGSFDAIHAEPLDPALPVIDRSCLPSRGRVWTVFENGPAARKMDLVILGDGYRDSEMPKFHADVQRLINDLFEIEPFRARRGDFNVRAIDLPAERSGITDPRRGIWRRSPLGLSYNAFGWDWYVLTEENEALREIAARAPYDALVLVFNGRKYGGGGIFNLFAIVSSDTAPSSFVLAHELGHSLAGLADEYYTAQIDYGGATGPGAEPWEPNITALLDPHRLKWHDLVEPETPIPTPWHQHAYDEAVASVRRQRRQLAREGYTDEQMEALFRQEKEAALRVLAAEPHAGKVGVFEGAGYHARGLYRPALNCIMFSRNTRTFCPVCVRAIERIIDLHCE